MNAIDCANEPLDYFSHSSRAFSDTKLKLLLTRYGFEGYGRWWALCELMAATENHSVKVGEEWELASLAYDLRIDENSLKEYLGYLTEIQLINIERLRNGEVFSDGMFKRAMLVGQKKSAARKSRSKK